MKEDNPTLGIIYFLASGVIMCLNFTTAKVLYHSHPDMTTAQLMFYRASTSTIVLGIMLNKDYKDLVIDSVERD